MSEKTRDLLAIASLVADRVQVIQHPEGLTNDSIGGSDLDCWIVGLDPQWPLRLPPGWRLLQALQYGLTQWQWWLEGPHGEEILDTTENPGSVEATPDAAPKSAEMAIGVSPAARAAYLSGKGLFKGTKRDASRWREISSLASQDPVFYQDVLRANFGPRIGGALAETGLRGVPPDARLVASSRRWRRSQWIRSPVTNIACAALEAKRILRRVMRPTGLVVLVVGPDGSGKSTFAQELMRATKTLFRRQLHVHWTPGVLPRASGLLGRPSADVTQPHGRELKSVPASYLALAYYWLDNFVGGWAVHRHARRRTGLVVVERGWWDIAVDPRRYRMRVAPWAVRFLGAVLPSPDVLFVLEGPAELFAARKRELPPEEIERQLSVWREIAPRVAATVALDASRPADVCVAEAREWMARHLEARTAARIGSGWLEWPRSGRPRFIFPRGPARAAASGLQIHQPMTRKGRIAWEAARLLAKAGGFRVSSRGRAPPHAVREILSKHIPRGGTVALRRTSQKDRWVALVVDGNGHAHRLIKLSTAAGESPALQWESANIERFKDRLVPPLLAPRLLESTANVLVFEPVDWLPRRRPWRLPADVAYAIGRLASKEEDGEGTIAHGDFVPWNLLRSREGWVVIDWEVAGGGYPAMFDLFHYLVQSHCLLGRPTQREIEQALSGRRGALAQSVLGAASGADVRPDSLRVQFVNYLDISRDMFDPRIADHKAAIKARDHLLAAQRTSDRRGN